MAFGSICSALKSNFILQVLVSKENTEIPVHRVILAISSKLIKSFESFEEYSRILLPEYAESVVKKFVEFVYSGQVLLSFDIREDFISICSDMMVDAVDLLRSNDTEDEPMCEEPSESAQLLPSSTSFEIKSELTFEESANVADDEEQDNFSTGESELLEEITESQYEVVHPKSRQCESTDKPNENLQQTSVGKYASRKRKLKSCSDSEPNAHDLNLQNAILDVKNGLNGMEAVRKYGVAKSTLYRWLKKKQK